MNPPSFGDALGAGWQAFKAQPVPLLIAMLCAMLLALIPLVGGMLATPGLLWVGLKALRGQNVEVGDAFVSFQRPLDHIVMGLFQIAGLLLCCIGVYVTQGLFFQGSLLIVDKGYDWNRAKDACLELKGNWLGFTLFALVIGLVAAAGTLACIIGVFVSVPVAMIAFAYAYEHGLGQTA